MLQTNVFQFCSGVDECKEEVVGSGSKANVAAVLDSEIISVLVVVNKAWLFPGDSTDLADLS